MDCRVEFQCRSCQNIRGSSASFSIDPFMNRNTVRATGDVVDCESCMDYVEYKFKTLDSTYANVIKVSKKHALNFERNEREIAFVTQDGSILYADILLLSSRSEVFEMMFEADMVEKETRRVTIDDVKTQTLKDFLFFLYEGELRKIPSRENVKELLQLAHRFNVKELVQRMDNFIQSQLVKDPCDLELLKLGFMYNLPMTKEFVRANATQEIVDKVYGLFGEEFPWHADFFKTVLSSPNIAWKRGQVVEGSVS